MTRVGLSFIESYFYLKSSKMPETMAYMKWIKGNESIHQMEFLLLIFTQKGKKIIWTIIDVSIILDRKMHHDGQS